VASIQRLHVLGNGDAHRRQFFQQMVCLNYDPRPFTVSEATEGPRTALRVFRIENPRQFRLETRSLFEARYVRTIERSVVVVGRQSAIRFHVYWQRGAPLWEKSHAYGYLINFGGKGGLVIEAWRYGVKPIPWKRYRANMVLVDRMAPTARVTSVAASSSVAVYLVRGEKVSPVRRLVPRTGAPARASLAALLNGPTVIERRSGYTSTIPSRTVLHHLSLARGVLTVDVSSRFQAGGGSLSMLLRVAQVVFTATQFPSVQRVAFRVDGRPVKAIGGEGVMVDPPVGRSAFEGQAPPILVEQPMPGDTVRAPLVVRGSANVFEAQLEVDVRTPAGKLLAHRKVHASAGTGTRGRFNVLIPLAPPTDKVVVVAFSRSAKNGAPVHTIRVPITVRRKH
jgi:spore germination protein GerM